jgi:hypothetical protein
MAEENFNEGLEQENPDSQKESISKELEKKELENKYYSQKKEIRAKLDEAEKALAENVEEVEKDYEQVMSEDPNLLTDEEKEEFKQYVETEKQKIKMEIETLQAHEHELELDYEDLKTEPKVDMLIDYAKKVNHAVSINAPLMKMLFDYFNFLNDNVKNQEKSKIMIDCFLDEQGLFMESFPQTTNVDYYYGSVMIDFKETERIIVTLKKYYEQGKGFVHKMGFVSEKKTYLNPDYLGKKILFNAIAHSKIKGTYITMGPNSIMWKQEKLERRAFSDIYLPKSIMEDLKLYTTLHDKTGKLLRYLMIGNPGTGKTESTLAIANYLKDNKVTVIKTMVCDALKEKVELAELLAPTIIIFDDIDLSLGSRKKGMISGGLAQFLDVLDGTEKIRKDVGIIATTNSLELLDMAAQRPGRFDKLLSFDSLTKGNIRDIVLKSLKYNFELDRDDKDVPAFIAPEVIEKLFTSRITGSHVYNIVKMLKLRIETLEMTDITPEWIMNEIKLELDTLSRIRKTDYLNDRLPGNTSGDIGFPMKNVTDSEEEYEEEYAEDCVAEVSSNYSSEMTFESSEQGGKEYKHKGGETEIRTYKPDSNESSDSERTEQNI